jgi:ABC-type transport system involved in Fe-S cluster assembly fused permease/ATPase subunit
MQLTRPRALLPNGFLTMLAEADFNLALPLIKIIACITVHTLRICFALARGAGGTYSIVAMAGVCVGCVRGVCVLCVLCVWVVWFVWFVRGVCVVCVVWFVCVVCVVCVVWFVWFVCVVWVVWFVRGVCDMTRTPARSFQQIVDVGLSLTRNLTFQPGQFVNTVHHVPLYNI